MYYIILGILNIVLVIIDMWVNLKIGKLAWERRTPLDKGLKIANWILMPIVSLTLFAKAAPENPFPLEPVGELSAYVDVIQ